MDRSHLQLTDDLPPSDSQMYPPRFSCNLTHSGDQIEEIVEPVTGNSLSQSMCGGSREVVDGGDNGDDELMSGIVDETSPVETGESGLVGELSDNFGIPPSERGRHIEILIDVSEIEEGEKETRDTVPGGELVVEQEQMNAEDAGEEGRSGREDYVEDRYAGVQQGQLNYNNDEGRLAQVQGEESMDNTSYDILFMGLNQKASSGKWCPSITRRS